jgi:hypothetical protein
MFRTTLVAAAATLVVASAASAQDARGAGRLDKDGDRRISLAEMQARQNERFVRLDLNRDGRLTREERQAARPAKRAAHLGARAGRQGGAFARLDLNRDGGLSQAESPKRLSLHFAQLDADRDGRLNQSELQAGRGILRAERGPKPARGERAQRVDANQDGFITRIEAAARVQVRFARLDANRDGFITRDERRSGRGQRRG